MLRMMMLYRYLLSYFFLHYSIIMLFRINRGVLTTIDREVKRMNKCLDYTIGPIIWLAHMLGMYVHELYKHISISRFSYEHGSITSFAFALPAFLVE